MKPLIFGGTTEGRIAVEVCEEAGKPFYYSIKGSSQAIKLHHGTLITGGMDQAEMLAFCKNKEVSLLIDAAHPFASVVHKNIGWVAESLSLPIIRLERKFPDIPASVRVAEDFDEAILMLNRISPNRLLALTGVNSISKLRPYWESHESFFRVMPIPDTELTLEQSGFPLSNIIYYDTELSDRELFRQVGPDLILIKESGESSGFKEKVEIALDLGIQVIVIRRPKLSYNANKTVVGKVGLRRAIETLLPNFFPLRIGFTTGTTATAATIAAMLSLLNGDEVKSVEVELPIGEAIPFPIQEVRVQHDCATAIAIKYAGDDPDMTDGVEIHSTVRYNYQHSGVHFLQGDGVGKVTLPGIGLPIGEPAINRVPRQMITKAISSLIDVSDTGIDVMISVPKGKEIATKTFNPRLGITDGISILGTTGVVRPYSLDTWIASIRREMEVSQAVGVKHLILNSGGRSEGYLKDLFPDLPSNAFVQYGNFIGKSLEIAQQLNFSQITLSIMLGKAVKLANGELDTHSKKVTMDLAFIYTLAEKSKLSERQLQEIRELNMARQLWEIIPNHDSPFYKLVLQHCYEVCKPIVPHQKLEILLIDDKGHFIRQ